MTLPYCESATQDAFRELTALGNYREQIKPQSESVFSTDEYGSNNIQLPIEQRQIVPL